MNKILTLQEYSNINEAKIDKDLEKLLTLLDASKLDGDFARWGVEIDYDSKKTGEIKVLSIIKGDAREPIWRIMPSTKDPKAKGELDFTVKDIVNISIEIIKAIKNIK